MRVSQSRPGRGKVASFSELCFSPLREKHNPADERYSAGDGRHRHSVRFVARCVDRPNVNDLLSNGVGETTPR
jgi:hypothetical protein